MTDRPSKLAAVLPAFAATKSSSSKAKSGTTPTTSPSDGPEIRRAAPNGLASAEWSKIRPALLGELLEAFKDGSHPILMHGPAGTGKSCASACLFQRWRHGVARWYRLEQFVRDIQTARRCGHVTHQVNGKPVDRTERTLWQFVENGRELWCLDDFGTRGATESAFDIIFELIDRRAKRPTIITSNLGLSELVQLFDRRIADRISAGTVIEVTGKSRRKGRRVKA